MLPLPRAISAPLPLLALPLSPRMNLRKSPSTLCSRTHRIYLVVITLHWTLHQIHTMMMNFSSCRTSSTTTIMFKITISSRSHYPIDNYNNGLTATPMDTTDWFATSIPKPNTCTNNNIQAAVHNIESQIGNSTENMPSINPVISADHYLSYLLNGGASSSSSSANHDHHMGNCYNMNIDLVTHQQQAAAPATERREMDLIEMVSSSSSSQFAQGTNTTSFYWSPRTIQSSQLSSS